MSFPAKSYSQRILENFKEALAPLAPVFGDESVNEIMINGPHDVFIRQRGPDRKLDVVLPSKSIETAITLLASMSDKVVGSEMRMLSARLPGFRVEACLPPVAVKGPSMCIRRHANKIFGIDEYVKAGTISEDQALVIQKIVSTRRNFLIAGGTFSGKTTLMNCILSLIDQDHRLFIVEQVQELKIAAPNCVFFECDPEQGVTARRLVKMGMRYSPDRVLLGELRGEEAFDWLDASNTGHPGSAATIHADGAPDALHRLESLILMADTKLPYEAIQQRIAQTVHYVLYIEHKNGKRCLSQVCQVSGFDRGSGKYILETTTNGAFNEH